MDWVVPFRTKMLSIIGPTSKQIVNIQNDKLLIIQGATWDDYWVLANEDLKVEFIQERLYIHSPASLMYEEIFGNLLTELRNYLKAHPVGKVLGSRFPILLAEGWRSEPDLFFLSNEEVRTGLSETVFKGSPSWIIEIISPNYREHDTQYKREEYRKINVKEYWIIDYEKKIIDITLYQNHQILSNKVITDGVLHPTITGLEDFSINLINFWPTVQKNGNS